VLLDATSMISCDVLGIGFGPSNLAVAIALHEGGSKLKAQFVEAAPQSGWHPNMLLDGSDIQNNPLRDLVTPRNPRSYFSFLNYLKCQDRLFDYLNLGLTYPLRKDYAKYIRWAASFFEQHVAYAQPALHVRS
jgi:L-ornithine N5-monooxygenase